MVKCELSVTGAILTKSDGSKIVVNNVIGEKKIKYIVVSQESETPFEIEWQSDKPNRDSAITWTETI